jgi:hypothetical protein
MVAVHVRDKNFHFSMETSFSLYHLPLYAFAAIEHYLLAFALDKYGWQASFCRWNASGRA